MKKLISVIMLVSMLMLCFGGCSISGLNGGNDNITESTVATTEAQVKLPDDFKNMNKVILATLVGMENTDIDYDSTKNEISWDLLIYLLKSNAGLSKATNNYGTGKMIIPDAYTKEFAAAMFASYNGISSLPDLPDSFDSDLILYDSSTGSYIVKKEDLGKRDIDIISTVSDGADGYRLTVNYMDTENDNTVASYKIVVSPSIYSTGKPIFNYTIVSISKVM